MNVAVTGGTGFIGRRLVEALATNGHTVRVLTRTPDHLRPRAPGVTEFVGDLRDDGTDFRSFIRGVEVVYHCAGVISGEAEMVAVHVDGTRRLVEVASTEARRWVQLSSVGVYGPVRGGVTRETSAERPVGTYETSKCRSDQIVRGYEDRFEVSILRPAIVFGSGMPNQSMPHLIRAISRGRFFYIGPPGSSANYIHVDNVVDCLQRCSASAVAAGMTFNLSESRTIEELVTSICAALGRAAPRVRVPLLPIRLAARLLGEIPGFPLTASRVDALTSRARYPTDLIEELLGYVPVMSFDAGVSDLVAWVQLQTRAHQV